jgi:hypothetical protein
MIISHQPPSAIQIHPAVKCKMHHRKKEQSKRVNIREFKGTISTHTVARSTNIDHE